MSSTVNTVSTAVDSRATTAIVDRCLDGWGPDLLGYLLGAGLDGDLAGWRLRDALRDDRVLARLEVAHALLNLFRDSRSARSWVRNINPELPRCSPAMVIRHGTAEAWQDLRTLAEGYEHKP